VTVAGLVQPEFGDLPGVGVEEVSAMLEAGKALQFIDARPRHFVSRTQEIIEGAVWRDPDRVHSSLTTAPRALRSGSGHPPAE
jgi:Fe-Mn family superoxide dismutase